VSLDDAGVRQVVLEASAGLDPALLEVGIVREGALGTPVTVTVSYRAGMAGPLAGWLLPEVVHLRAAASMRQEVG
jgi:hypothetical protein